MAAQQPASPHKPCDEKPINQRQMDDSAAFEYREADPHLNKVYQKAMQYMADDLSNQHLEVPRCSAIFNLT
jgi:uncharacterized protein YecT (DUF1311 family)